jgi:hypothetical protein
VDDESNENGGRIWPWPMVDYTLMRWSKICGLAQFFLFAEFKTNNQQIPMTKINLKKKDQIKLFIH